MMGRKKDTEKMKRVREWDSRRRSNKSIERENWSELMHDLQKNWGDPEKRIGITMYGAIGPTRHRRRIGIRGTS